MSIDLRRRLKSFFQQQGLIVALVSFWLGLIWISVIQPLDAPDEPAHLQAIMQVRKQYMIPEIKYDPGNPNGEVIGSPGDPESRAYITGLLSKLPTNDSYILIPYESTQPPLYYLAVGLATQIVPPDPQLILYIGRFISVLFGAGAVFFAWLAAREIVPRAPMLAVASAGAMALLPQFCFNNATSGNDSTTHLASTAAFYVWFRGLRRPQFDLYMVGAGAMLGLALLSKLTAVALIPGLALVVLFRTLQVRPRELGVGKWLLRGLYLAIGAVTGTLLVCGWWLVRNIFVYGEPTGMDAALRFYAAKFFKADFSLPETAGNLTRWSLESLWGRYGWNDITLPQEWYQFANNAVLWLIGITGLTALVYIALRVIGKLTLNVTWQAFVVFAAIGLVLFVAYIQFNQTIAYQPQARYFFIMLLPATLLVMGGLYLLPLNRALRTIALAIPLIGLGILNAVSLLVVSSAR
jgi:4-amino-4-deoxy-L-arabinose transferase-like glycosyltransferase